MKSQVTIPSGCGQASAHPVVAHMEEEVALSGVCGMPTVWVCLHSLLMFFLSVRRSTACNSGQLSSNLQKCVPQLVLSHSKSLCVLGSAMPTWLTEFAVTAS